MLLICEIVSLPPTNTVGFADKGLSGQERATAHPHPESDPSFAQRDKMKATNSKLYISSFEKDQKTEITSQWKCDFAGKIARRKNAFQAWKKIPKDLSRPAV